MTHTPAGRHFHDPDSHNVNTGRAPVNDWMGSGRTAPVGA